jgi:hypothetical protein
VVLHLTDSEAEHLAVIVDSWLGEFEDATNDTIGDRYFDKPEDLLQAVSGIHQLFSEAVNIRQKLRECVV